MKRMSIISLCTLAVGLAVAGCSSSEEETGTNTTGTNTATTGGATSAATTGGATNAATTGGATSTTGAPANLGDPPCGVTEAGLEAKKGTACTETDVQLCWRTCGPNSVGWKSETCTAGAYVEGDCQFPAGDYSCYAIPAAVDATCPATAPQATMECTVAECTPCNTNGEYLDSSGAVKVGYCVCGAPDNEGLRKWTCASDTAWPCPAGEGCSG